MKYLLTTGVLLCALPFTLLATPSNTLAISATQSANNKIDLFSPKQTSKTKKADHKIMATKLLNVVETQQTIAPWHVICAEKKSEQNQKPQPNAPKPFKYCSATQKTAVKLIGGLTIYGELIITPISTPLKIENAIPKNNEVQLLISNQKPTELTATCVNLPSKQMCALSPRNKQITLASLLAKTQPGNKMELFFIDKNTGLSIKIHFSLQNYDQINQLMQDSRAAVKQEFSKIYQTKKK